MNQIRQFLRWFMGDSPPSSPTSLDRLVAGLPVQQKVGNPQTRELPFAIGAPGDCLAWTRERLMEQEVSRRRRRHPPPEQNR